MFRIILIILIVYVFYRFVLVYLIRLLTTLYLERQKRDFYRKNPGIRKTSSMDNEENGFLMRKPKRKQFISFFISK